MATYCLALLSPKLANGVSQAVFSGFCHTNTYMGVKMPSSPACGMQPPNLINLLLGTGKKPTIRNWKNTDRGPHSIGTIHTF
eukprot:jgi/Botrbrau1/3167/Bobra.37_2s0002.1